MEIDAESRRQAAEGMSAVGAELHRRGWSLATSSNYSVRLSESPLRLLITVSGKDKGALTPDDFVLVDESGRGVEPNSPKSSAETMLHVVLAQHGAGAVLHTHSVWGNVLSDRYGAEGLLELSGYEMLKAFVGVDTHDGSVDVPIYPNTQDIPSLAEEIAAGLRSEESPLRHGFLIHKHGLYTWGDTLADARRHLEAFEFLFECEGRRLSLAPM